MYSGGNPVIASTTVLKEISVFPQPLQKPHPQVWMPLTSERSIRWAAERGINGGFMAEPNWKLKQNVEVFYEEAEKQGWPDRLNRGRLKYGWDADKHRGVMIGRVVHIMNDPGDTEEYARVALGTELGWSYYGPFGFTAVLANRGEKLPTDIRVPLEFLIERGIAFVGPSEQVAEQILKMKADIGAEDFNFFVSLELAGFEGAEVEEQMHLFADEVLPILRRECGGSAWAEEARHGEVAITARA
jgi:alkanesulfonate monooxygenase SsuD/methylene tetrahydromethanopterin reductase-like flavin-dependent oxidoreductase (luciferase family)